MAIAKLTTFLLVISAAFSDDYSTFYKDYFEGCSAEQLVKLLTGQFSNKCSERNKYRKERYDSSEDYETYYPFAVYFPSNQALTERAMKTRCIEQTVRAHSHYYVITYTYYQNITGDETKRVDKYILFKTWSYPSQTVVMRSRNGTCEAYNWLYIVNDKNGYVTAACSPLSDNPDIQNVYYVGQERTVSDKVIAKYNRLADEVIGGHDNVKLSQKNCPHDYK